VFVSRSLGEGGLFPPMAVLFAGANIMSLLQTCNKFFSFIIFYILQKS
jgi:hypothetical protein